MKERTFKMEEQFLSPFAKKSINTEGRDNTEIPCPMRTEFQRDRDRILYSKAFRRLKNKTQVFYSPEGDHYRTRLTHTLDVTQVARSIARSLYLNEDLAEAIALGHDLGHTPFGHSGERILNKLCSHGFKHNVQSRRVVEILENAGNGLNLTKEVRDGIENHKMSLNPSTLEGKVVSFSDWIAYINHDIDDAIDAKIITENDLPKNLVKVLGKTSRERINTMILAIVSASDGQNKVAMEQEVFEATRLLREFLFEVVYNSKQARGEEIKAERMLSAMYEYYTIHPEEISEYSEDNIAKWGVETVVCDYLSGMTDRYAVSTFNSIYIPKSWKIS
ncbi:MAG: deoxyguanosinetriphosphate triphosphohydrolase [Clostridia bacterium]|nr:deoxyguanosinetriphosphate triphosphohydrolase [Clostridia bacterium]